MAGITDRPFRMLCREMGAAMAVSEMVTSNKQLCSKWRTDHRHQHGLPGEKSLQRNGGFRITQR